MNEETLQQYSQYINADYVPDTADKYIATFRAMAALVDHVLTHLENNRGNSEHDFKQSVDYAAHMVEFLALMRGERGVLLEDIKPSLVDTGHQSEMYKVEDYLRHRLVELGYTYKD